MSAEELKVLKGARLIDGNGGEPIKNGVIVIDGKRIKEVGAEKQVRIPSGAEVIDMGDCTLMPGLIDAHIHISAPNVVSFTNYRAASLETTPQLQMLYTLFHSQICLEMGFTTLRHAGWINSHGEIDVPEMAAIRDAINAGLCVGPRISVGGIAVGTNNHLTQILPVNVVLDPYATGDGPHELRRIVRRRLREKCDYIKTCASGGGTDIGDIEANPKARHITQEELDAIVDEAHAYGHQVACHCHSAESQRMAVKAGVDTIEHCVYTDDEAISMMKEANSVIVPTLFHRTDYAIELSRRAGANEYAVNSIKNMQPYAFETFQKVHKAGIKIAMGTDTEVQAEMGGMAREIELYVNFGMTPMEAIQTATKNAAEAIWLGEDTGTLDVGKFADVIAVDGNPLDDMRVLSDRKKISLVMKEGKVYTDKRTRYEKYVISDPEWRQKAWNYNNYAGLHQGRG